MQALHNFDAQYFALSAQFSEFLIFGAITSRRASQRTLDKLDRGTRAQLDAVRNLENTLDIGFSSVSSILATLEADTAKTKANRALNSLHELYKVKISAPLLSEDRFAGDEPIPIRFPSVDTIFIPQRYKVLRYEARRKLEDDDTWTNIAPRDDLPAFLIRYLNSPYSCKSPLIILGMPGSGKSLLSYMIAAQIAHPLYIPIRVELRNINADNSIDQQVLEQIKRDSRQSDISWVDVQAAVSDGRPLVILDGYDELLQASGQVHAGYLKNVREFQLSEARLTKQPMRAIVSSRVTLIDKAHTPPGATILKLEEFDRSRRDKWVEIWNTCNKEYYASDGRRPLVIPEDDERIVELASQPLLLLMLAIYDTVGTRLAEHKELDKTVLYNDLLSQFVKRERAKDPEFAQLPAEQQDAEVDEDMRRLGVSAIGMFNRRAFHIMEEQLNKDIKFFGCEREINGAGTRRRLSQAQLLLGGFFFVQEDKETEDDLGHANYAYQFLHATFGEFLACDFVLRACIFECKQIVASKSNAELAKTLEERARKNEFLADTWYSCLAYAPLFDRPVVLSMMREWTVHRIKKGGFSKHELFEALDFILHTQLRLILNGNGFPNGAVGGGGAEFPRLPALGHLAIYSLNLLTLRTVLAEETYDFYDRMIDVSVDGARTWDRLAAFWRSWFSPENLHALSAVFRVAGAGREFVTLAPKENFALRSTAEGLGIQRDIASCLGDTPVQALCSLISEYDLAELDRTYRKLAVAGIDLWKQFLRRKINIVRFLVARGSEIGRPPSSEEIVEIFAQFYSGLAQAGRRAGSPSELSLFWEMLDFALEFGSMEDARRVLHAIAGLDHEFRSIGSGPRRDLPFHPAALVALCVKAGEPEGLLSVIQSSRRRRDRDKGATHYEWAMDWALECACRGGMSRTY